MTDFYVTLPSSVPNPQFKNTSSRYITRLPEVLNLERDKYVVAATDVIYPYSYVNVGKPLDYWIHFKSKHPIHIAIPPDQYSDAEQIVKTLNGDKPRVRLKRSAALAMIEREMRVKRAKTDGEETVGSLAEQFDSLAPEKKDSVTEMNDLFNSLAPAQTDSVTEMNKQFQSLEKKDDSGNVFEEYDALENAEKTKRVEAQKEISQIEEFLAENEPPAAVDKPAKPETSAKVEDGEPKSKLPAKPEEEKKKEEKKKEEKPKEEKPKVVKTSDKPAKEEPKTSDKPTKPAKPAKVEGKPKSELPAKPAKPEEPKPAKPKPEKPEKPKVVKTSENPATVKEEKKKTVEQKMLDSLVDDYEAIDPAKQKPIIMLDEHVLAQPKKTATPTVAPTFGTDQEALDAMFDDYERLGKPEEKAQKELDGLVGEYERLAPISADVEIQQLDNEFTNLDNAKKMHDETLGEYDEQRLAIAKKSLDETIYRQNVERFKKTRARLATETRDSSKELLAFKSKQDQLEVEFLDPDILFIEFDEPCAYFLGFVDPIVRENTIAEKKIDYFGNVSTLYLYCDVVDPIIVGNTKSSLLSVIPCQGRYGEMIHHTVAHPRYLPLMKASIDSIRVDLLTEFSEPIDFNWGSTILVLHFKRA